MHPNYRPLLFNIETVDESDFSYRMSWFSDESPEFSLLGCIIGGGNKNEQFALKYRQYMPTALIVSPWAD